MTPRIINLPVVNLEAGNYSQRSAAFRRKDQYKSDFSTKFIGRGIGSTGEYERMHRQRGIPVNSGEYSQDDVVFISSNGNRPGAYDPDLVEIKKAVDAGATFLTDGKKNRPEGGRAYNTGEQMVAEFLRKSGYEEQVELNGEVSRWYKKGTAPAFIIKDQIHKQRLAQLHEKDFQWSRKSQNGFEVSTAAKNLSAEQGDKRFSAFNAKLKDGRSIEEAYQLDVKGYRIDGNDWRLGKGKPPKIGIQFEVDESTGYRERTIANASADATIAIAADFSTAGEKLTMAAVKGQQKIYIPVQFTGGAVSIETIGEIVDRLNKAKAATINIAGNGAYTLTKYTQRHIDDVVYNLLNRVVNHPKLENRPTLIRSGGQSGIDEAGVKAAQRLGIQALVLAPKTWMYKDANGTTIKDIRAFKARFQKNPEQLYREYKSLWQQWASENPQLIDELAVRAAGKVLTDTFANTQINQARALAEILNEKLKERTDHINKKEQAVNSTEQPGQLTFSDKTIKKLKLIEAQFDSGQIDSLEQLGMALDIKVSDLSKQVGKEINPEDYKELFTKDELIWNRWNTLSEEEKNRVVSKISNNAEKQIAEAKANYDAELLTHEEYVHLCVHIKTQDIYTQRPEPLNIEKYANLFSGEELAVLRSIKNDGTDVLQRSADNIQNLNESHAIERKHPKVMLAKNDHAVLKEVDPPDPYVPRRYQQETIKYKVIPIEELNVYNKKSKVQKIPVFTGTKTEASMWANGPDDIRALVERRKEVRMEIHIPLRNSKIDDLQVELDDINASLGLPNKKVKPEQIVSSKKHEQADQVQISRIKMGM